MANPSLPLAVAGAIAAASLAALPPDARIAPDGFGPLRVGLTRAQVAELTGLELRAPPTGDDARCWYLRPADTSAKLPVRVMMSFDRLVRIETADPALLTVEGARVGDPEARVLELYSKRVARTEHKYVDGGAYLTVTPAGSARLRLVFETDGKKISAIRAGELPAVGYVEGCG